MILDFHTHLGDIFPGYTGIRLHDCAPAPPYVMISSEAIVDATRIFYRSRPPVWSFGFLKHVALTLLRRKRMLRGMVIPNLLQDMQHYAITHSVVLPIEYPDMIDRSARLITACQSTTPLLPFCSVHPRDPQRLSKLHTYMHNGAYGLKLHPNFQQVPLDDRATFELCEAYREYHRPLILHSGLTGRERWFQPHKRYASLERLTELPGNFPDLPIVLAHAGITQYAQAIRLGQKHDNIYLEISGQPARHIRQALDALGVERLLFGSDWPFWPQHYALEAVHEATYHDHQARRSLLCENANRLLQRA